MKTLKLEGPDMKLVSFIYILLRDKLTAGEIETMMKDHVENVESIVVFSNEFLARYAVDIATRIKK